MDARSELLEAFSRHCKATGLAPATVSTQAANDGKFYKSIVEGAGFTMQRYERVMKWFDENKPKHKSKKSKLT